MQTNPALPRVNPNQIFPCQIIAARSRNGAVDALESRDTGAIVYRYLNNRYQQRCFRRNAVIGAFVPVIGWGYSGVNTHNTLRCRESKRACKQELQKRLPPAVFAQIRQEPHAYGNYLGALKKAGIDTKEIKRLRHTHGQHKAAAKKGPAW